MEHRPRLDHLEIDITYECGLNCHNCNRLTQLLPGTPQDRVTPAQIAALIEESMRLDYPWRRWWLVGGEPTTHPQLLPILELIASYRDRRGLDQFQVGLATNGLHPRVISKAQQQFPFLEVLDSAKTSPQQPHFVCVCMAPRDRFDLTGHEFIGCGVSWNCGIALNFAGFYPCAVAAAIDRVLGATSPIKELANVNEENMRRTYQILCPLCGYYRDPLYCGTRTKLSPTWQRLIAAARHSG